jgi:hypothetical protein
MGSVVSTPYKDSHDSKGIPRLGNCAEGPGGAVVRANPTKSMFSHHLLNPWEAGKRPVNQLERESCIMCTFHTQLEPQLDLLCSTTPHGAD